MMVFTISFELLNLTRELNSAFNKNLVLFLKKIQVLSALMVTFKSYRVFINQNYKHFSNSERFGLKIYGVGSK